MHDKNPTCLESLVLLHLQFLLLLSLIDVAAISLLLHPCVFLTTPGKDTINRSPLRFASRSPEFT